MRGWADSTTWKPSTRWNVKKRRSQWSQLSPTQDLWLTLDRGQSLQVSAKMWKAFPRSILEDVIARMMCSKCLADLPSATGTVGERWERQRARATKGRQRRDKERKESLCSVLSGDSLQPQALAATHSDKALKEPSLRTWGKRGSFSCCLLELTKRPECKHFPDIIMIIIPLLLLLLLDLTAFTTDRHAGWLGSVCVYPQPSVRTKCCAPYPGVCSQVFYDGAGLEFPNAAVHTRHCDYDHSTNTRTQTHSLGIYWPLYSD